MTLETLDWENLVLQFEDCKSTVDYLAKNGIDINLEDEKIVEMFVRLTYGVIRHVEVDKKANKRLIPNFVTVIQKLDDEIQEKVMKSINSTISSIPMIIQTKWEFLSMLATRKLVHIENETFIELQSCGSDQDLAARSSVMILQIATDLETADRAAEIIFRNLTSPIPAIRNNAQRSWLGRLVAIGKSKPCVETILRMCRNRVLTETTILPVNFREVAGLSCVDLEWKPMFEEEAFDDCTYALLAYFTVLIAIRQTSSRVRVALDPSDQLVQRGLDYVGYWPVNKMAIMVAQKYKVHTENLEKSIMRMMGNSEIYDLVDDEVLKTFSEEAREHFGKSKEKYFENEKEKVADLGKLYPAVDEGRLDVQVHLFDENSTLDTLQRFLKVQHPTEKYPSVAAVMENLKLLEIDERLYCQKIIQTTDSVVENFRKNIFSKKSIIQFLMTAITQIPLRSVVDYIGDIIKTECSDDQFKNEIFQMAIQLLEDPGESGPRPLSLYHCFYATCRKDTENEKIGKVWEIVKNLNIRKMSEMLAKVVQNSEIRIEIPILEDMILSSLGMKSEVFQNESTQLFEASISKYLDFRNETERILLFSAFFKIPTLGDLISTILSHPTSSFSDSSSQMILYFFTRFHVGALYFYTLPQIDIIQKIIDFCRFSIQKFARQPLICGVAIDAICGFLPWDFIRSHAIQKENLSFDDPIEQTIVRNLRYHRLWVMLADQNKKDTVMKIEDFEKLPFANFVVEVLKRKNDGDEAIIDLCDRLKNSVRNSVGFETRHADSLAFGILVDRAIEMMDEAEKCREEDPESDYRSKYPSSTFSSYLIDIANLLGSPNMQMVNSWLAKSLIRQKILQERRDSL